MKPNSKSKEKPSKSTPKARPSASFGLQEKSKNSSKSPKDPSKNPSKNPQKNRPTSNLENQQTSKNSSKSPKNLQNSSESEIPPLPEEVKILMKADPEALKDFNGLQWKNSKKYPKFEHCEGHEIPKCFRYQKDFVILRYSEESIIRRRLGPATLTQRNAMISDGVISKKESNGIGDVTESFCRFDFSEDNLEQLQKKVEPKKAEPKIQKTPETLKTQKTSGESKEPEKIQKTSREPLEIQKTPTKVKDSDENNRKLSKESEDQKKKKEMKYEESHYVLEELNEKTSHYLGNPETEKNSEDFEKMSTQNLKVIEGTEGVKKEKLEIPEDVKNRKNPEASEGITGEMLKISKTPEELKENVPEDVKAPGAPKPDIQKTPDDVKNSEDHQKSKNPDFIQSNYIAKGLNEESGYCTQKDSGFSKDGNNQKTSKDFEGSKSQNPGSSGSEGKK